MSRATRAPIEVEMSAGESEIDRVLADSFPASDSPPWTLGVDPERSIIVEAEIMRDREIVVTESDQKRLRHLLEGVRRWNARDRAHVNHLEAELDRAHVVDPSDVPADVVTMNSEVVVRDVDSNEEMTFAVVYPSEAALELRRVSILAPIGTAVLGYRVGDTIQWDVPGRTRRLKIERLLFQPEAARTFEVRDAG